MARNGTTPVKAVRTNFRIIEALRDLDGAGVTELARHVDLAKSSVHDHLQTLVDCGYVHKEEYVYRLAPRFIELGGHTRRRMPLYRAAKPEIDDLAADTRTRATVTIELRGTGVVVAEANGADAVPGAGVEATVSLCETAPGRVLLAHMSEDRLDAVVDSVESDGDDEASPGDAASGATGERDGLGKLCRRIRREGYARDEPEDGVDRVAVPIKDERGDVCGALTLSGPAERLRPPSSAEGAGGTHRRGSIGGLRTPDHGKEASVREDSSHKFPWKGSIQAPQREEQNEVAGVDNRTLAAMRRTAGAIESQLERQ